MLVSGQGYRLDFLLGGKGTCRSDSKADKTLIGGTNLADLCTKLSGQAGLSAFLCR